MVYACSTVLKFFNEVPVNSVPNNLDLANEHLFAHTARRKRNLLNAGTRSADRNGSAQTTITPHNWCP